MTTNTSSIPPAAERIHDLPSILKAVQRAVHEALLDHKRAGNPVAVWRNERVEWIQPQDIQVVVDEPEVLATWGV